MLTELQNIEMAEKMLDMALNSLQQKFKELPKKSDGKIDIDNIDVNQIKKIFEIYQIVNSLRNVIAGQFYYLTNISGKKNLFQELDSNESNLQNLPIDPHFIRAFSARRKFIEQLGTIGDDVYGTASSVITNKLPENLIDQFSQLKQFFENKAKLELSVSQKQELAKLIELIRYNSKNRNNETTTILATMFMDPYFVFTGQRKLTAQRKPTEQPSQKGVESTNDQDIPVELKTFALLPGQTIPSILQTIVPGIKDQDVTLTASTSVSESVRPNSSVDLLELNVYREAGGKKLDPIKDKAIIARKNENLGAALTEYARNLTSILFTHDDQIKRQQWLKINTETSTSDQLEKSKSTMNASVKKEKEKKKESIQKDSNTRSEAEEKDRDEIYRLAFSELLGHLTNESIVPYRAIKEIDSFLKKCELTELPANLAKEYKKKVKQLKQDYEKDAKQAKESGVQIVAKEFPPEELSVRVSELENKFFDSINAEFQKYKVSSQPTTQVLINLNNLWESYSEKHRSDQHVAIVYKATVAELETKLIIEIEAINKESIPAFEKILKIHGLFTPVANNIVKLPYDVLQVRKTILTDLFNKLTEADLHTAVFYDPFNPEQSLTKLFELRQKMPADFWSGNTFDDLFGTEKNKLTEQIITKVSAMGKSNNIEELISQFNAIVKIKEVINNSEEINAKLNLVLSVIVENIAKTKDSMASLDLLLYMDKMETLITVHPLPPELAQVIESNRKTAMNNLQTDVAQVLQAITENKTIPAIIKRQLLFQLVSQLSEDQIDKYKSQINELKNSLFNEVKQQLHDDFLSAFRKITHQDMVNNEKNKKQQIVTNLTLYIKLYVDVTSVINTDIMSSRNSDAAAAAIDFWMKMAYDCIQSGNFAAAMSIISALSETKVLSLINKLNLSNESRAIFSFINQFGGMAGGKMDAQGNFLREVMEASTAQTIIPFVGGIQTTLTLMEEESGVNFQTDPRSMKIKNFIEGLQQKAASSLSQETVSLNVDALPKFTPEEINERHKQINKIPMPTHSRFETMISKANVVDLLRANKEVITKRVEVLKQLVSDATKENKTNPVLIDSIKESGVVNDTHLEKTQITDISAKLDTAIKRSAEGIASLTATTTTKKEPPKKVEQIAKEKQRVVDEDKNKGKENISPQTLSVTDRLGAIGKKITQTITMTSSKEAKVTDPSMSKTTIPTTTTVTAQAGKVLRTAPTRTEMLSEEEFKRVQEFKAVDLNAEIKKLDDLIDELNKDSTIRNIFVKYYDPMSANMIDYLKAEAIETLSQDPVLKDIFNQLSENIPEQKSQRDKMIADESNKIGQRLAAQNSFADIVRATSGGGIAGKGLSVGHRRVQAAEKALNLYLQSIKEDNSENAQKIKYLISAYTAAHQAAKFKQQFDTINSREQQLTEEAHMKITVGIDQANGQLQKFKSEKQKLEALLSTHEDENVIDILQQFRAQLPTTTNPIITAENIEAIKSLSTEKNREQLEAYRMKQQFSKDPLKKAYVDMIFSLDMILTDIESNSTITNYSALHLKAFTKLFDENSAKQKISHLAEDARLSVTDASDIIKITPIQPEPSSTDLDSSVSRPDSVETPKSSEVETRPRSNKSYDEMPIGYVSASGSVEGADKTTAHKMSQVITKLSYNNDPKKVVELIREYLSRNPLGVLTPRPDYRRIMIENFGLFNSLVELTKENSVAGKSLSPDVRKQIKNEIIASEILQSHYWLGEGLSDVDKANLNKQRIKIAGEFNIIPVEIKAKDKATTKPWYQNVWEVITSFAENSWNRLKSLLPKSKDEKILDKKEVSFSINENLSKTADQIEKILHLKPTRLEPKELADGLVTLLSNIKMMLTNRGDVKLKPEVVQKLRSVMLQLDTILNPHTDEKVVPINYTEIRAKLLKSKSEVDETLNSIEKAAITLSRSSMPSPKD